MILLYLIPKLKPYDRLPGSDALETEEFVFLSDNLEKNLNYETRVFAKHYQYGCKIGCSLYSVRTCIECIQISEKELILNYVTESIGMI